jgi:endonuclease YncB( thermonuclease family)
LAAVCLAVSPVAYAQQPAPAANPPCWFDQKIGEGRVDSIIDGRSFMLADGRTVRLAAIEVPPLPAPGPQSAPSGPALAAKSALESILRGQSIELRHTTPETDRYGRAVAYAFVATGDRHVSVENTLLARGFARVSAQVGDLACATALLSREREARAAKLGLWGDPYYEIVPAGKGAELLARRGQFTVVEGKVLSVRESGGTIYVNFGRRWSQALTVTISKRRARIFTDAGIVPKVLENRPIRVRGWVEARNGPRIEALRPEQIEIITGN